MPARVFICCFTRPQFIPSYTLKNICFKGIQNLLSKNVFVSHRGKEEHFCGNWTLPCRSVRQAVNISNANDVIYIDYVEGRPYEECEDLISDEKHTIMLDKSLSFYGFNGSAMLQCKHTYPFFGIKNSPYTTSKIVFAGLTLASRGILIIVHHKIQNSMFYLELNFCDINRTNSCYQGNIFILPRSNTQF